MLSLRAKAKQNATIVFSCGVLGLEPSTSVNWMSAPPPNYSSPGAMFLFLFFLNSFISISCALCFACMYICVRVLDHLKLELETIVSFLVGLGIKPVSSGKAVSPLIH